MPDGLCAEAQELLESDCLNYSMVPNVCDKLPETIDLLVLDGGEYTSQAEFHKFYKRAKYIVMDDTNPEMTIKFVAVREEILAGRIPVQVIKDRFHDRNGWLVVKRP
jgi:hypothetical protein